MDREDISDNNNAGEVIKNQVQDGAEHVGVLGSDTELHDEDQHEPHSAGHGQD